MVQTTSATKLLVHIRANRIELEIIKKFFRNFPQYIAAITIIAINLVKQIINLMFRKKRKIN